MEKSKAVEDRMEYSGRTHLLSMSEIPAQSNMGMRTRTHTHATGMVASNYDQSTLEIQVGASLYI